MKNNKLITIFKCISLILAAAVVGFYLFDVLYNKTPATENIFRTVAVVCMLIGGYLRLNAGQGSRGRGFYEKAYKNELGTAFADRPALRRRLVDATRLYDEGKFVEALDRLEKLLYETEGDDDVIPILLFTALCYSDLHMYDRTIEVYNELISYQPDNARYHSNLGMVYAKIGDNATAIVHYDKAIECDPENYYAYNNRAYCFFDMQDYDSAAADAKKALDIKNNGMEAATLLAITYALQEDEEGKSKYYRLAITSGRSAKEMDNIIEHYMSEQAVEDE